jgi:hypothetical protein
MPQWDTYDILAPYCKVLYRVALMQLKFYLSAYSDHGKNVLDSDVCQVTSAMQVKFCKILFLKLSDRGNMYIPIMCMFQLISIDV